MRIARALLGVVGLLYGLVVLLAWAGQRQLVYNPDPRKISPSAVGLGSVEERWVEAADGVRFVAWYGRPRPGQPTLLYYHGNGGNLALRAERIRRFMERGWGIYMMSYRGYSGSGGLPSEVDNVSDAKLAWQDLLRTGVRADDVVIYGESLGTGVATQVALDAAARGLILDAPFTSIVDIGASRFPMLPVRLLLSHRYETINVIGEVRMPLLVVHGEADRIVPVEMGRQVFAAATRAPEPKRLVTFPGAGHANHMRFGSFDAIAAFIRDVKLH
jgi:pimeloyl-ACP methyl ester carboxylesterase